MIYEELKLPIPIYDRFEKQYRFSKGESINKAIVSRDRILPFQFIIPMGAEAPDLTEWTIRGDDTPRTIKYDLTEQGDALEYVETAAGNVYVIYKAPDISLLMGAGTYHMEFVIDSVRYFSEQFDVRCDSPYWADQESAYSRIDYKNDCDLGPIMYQTGYVNRIYLDTAIHNENPTIEEEGSEDGNGNFIPALQQYIDNLSLEYVCPYNIADALVLLAMHSNVVLTLPNTIYSGRIRNITPTVKQEDGLWSYRVTLAFQQDSKYINGACCSNIELADHVTGECNARILSHIDIEEDSAGITSILWDVVGNYDRIKLEWSVSNLSCEMSDTVYLTNGETIYTINSGLYAGSLNVKITPQCQIGGNWIDGQFEEASKTVENPIPCNPDPIPEPTGSNIVTIENNTTFMVVYGVTGIPGFSSGVVGYQGTKTGTRTGDPGAISIYFYWINPSYGNAKLYVNGELKECINIFQNPPRTFAALDDVPVDADILITVNNGAC